MFSYRSITMNDLIQAWIIGIFLLSIGIILITRHKFRKFKLNSTHKNIQPLPNRNTHLIGEHDNVVFQNRRHSFNPTNKEANVVVMRDKSKMVGDQSRRQTVKQQDNLNNFEMGDNPIGMTNERGSVPRKTGNVVQMRDKSKMKGHNNVKSDEGISNKDMQEWYDSMMKEGKSSS